MQLSSMTLRFPYLIARPALLQGLHSRADPWFNVSLHLVSIFIKTFTFTNQVEIGAS